MGAIFISDPVAQVNYTLHTESRTVEKSPQGSIVLLKAENKIFFSNAPAPIYLPSGVAVPGGSSTKTEQLGTIQMEGVLAQGTRTTTTIPAGQIGNDRPINVVYERWYSPDLQLTVMTKLSDPRSGETVYRLTNIVRVEQVRSLFEVPSDYALAANPVLLQGIVRGIQHPQQ
jgi:hypothetical protein